MMARDLPRKALAAGLKRDPAALLGRAPMHAALVAGCMYAPNDLIREGTSALAWRRGLKVESLNSTGAGFLREAQGVVHLLQRHDHDRNAHREVAGIVGLIGLALAASEVVDDLLSQGLVDQAALRLSDAVGQIGCAFSLAAALGEALCESDQSIASAAYALVSLLGLAGGAIAVVREALLAMGAQPLNDELPAEDRGAAASRHLLDGLGSAA